jgi:hypothetical protein
MQIKVEDLVHITGMSRKFFVDFSDGLRLEGMKRKLDQQEIIVLSYYNAVIQHLASKGLLQPGVDYNMNFIKIDSLPDVDDYA